MGLRLPTIVLAMALAAVASSIAGDSTRQKVTFQEGVNGYVGTVDLEIWAVSPNTCLEGNPNASSDADNDGGESQVLMRFDDIVSAKDGFIPPKAAIHSA